MADEGTKVAAYIPWKTFKNSLDRFSQGLPNRIDKTVFKGQSGSIQTQILASLKFLGLIDDDLVPTALMKGLVEKNELERKGDLVAIFRTSYGKLFDLDLAKATPQQIDQEMTASYGVSGSTLRKATRFFLVGAGDLGIPLSTFLAAAKGSANGGAPRRRSARKERIAQGDAQDDREVGAPRKAASPLRVFKLRTATAELTISTSKDFLSLIAADRKLLFDLMETVEKYEQESMASDPSGQSQGDAGGEE